MSDNIVDGVFLLGQAPIVTPNWVTSTLFARNADHVWIVVPLTPPQDNYPSSAFNYNVILWSIDFGGLQPFISLDMFWLIYPSDHNNCGRRLVGERIKVEQETLMKRILVADESKKYQQAVNRFLNGTECGA